MQNNGLPPVPKQIGSLICSYFPGGGGIEGLGSGLGHRWYGKKKDIAKAEVISRNIFCQPFRECRVKECQKSVKGNPQIDLCLLADDLFLVSIPGAYEADRSWMTIIGRSVF